VRFTAAELAEIRHAFHQHIATAPGPKRGPRPKRKREPSPKHKREPSPKRKREPNAAPVLVREPEYDDGDILTTRDVADIFGGIDAHCRAVGRSRDAAIVSYARRSPPVSMGRCAWPTLPKRTALAEHRGRLTRCEP
jgi:hypothetical protein